MVQDIFFPTGLYWMVFEADMGERKPRPEGLSDVAVLPPLYTWIILRATTFTLLNSQRG